MNKMTKIVVVVVAVAIVGIFLRDRLIQSAITTVGSNVLGASVEIKHFSLSLISQKVSIKGLKVYNPQGFPKGVMVDVPEVSVRWDLPAFFKGHVHLPDVVVNLKEMVLVKNREGQLNVDSLKVAKKDEKKSTSASNEKAKNINFSIDELKLNVERVVMKDYTKNEQYPLVTVHELALKNKVFKNINGVEQLSTLILVQAMGPMATQGVAIYAAATVLGVGFLPAGIVGALVAKDSAHAEYAQSLDHVFSTTEKLLTHIGQIKSADKTNGTIKALVQGVDVNLNISIDQHRHVLVNVNARQMMLPKPEIAAGIVYQLNEVLKR